MQNNHNLNAEKSSKFQFQCTSLAKKLLLHTLKKEIQLVVEDKSGFQQRLKKILWICERIWTNGILTQTMNKTTFQSNTPPKLQLSVESLFNEIVRLVKKKKEFDNQLESIFWTVLEHSNHRKFELRTKKFYCPFFFFNWRAFGCDPGSKIEPRRCGETWVWN